MPLCKELGCQWAPLHLPEAGVSRRHARAAKPQQQGHAMAEAARAQNRGETGPKGKVPSLSHAKHGAQNKVGRGLLGCLGPQALAWHPAQKGRGLMSVRGSRVLTLACGRPCTAWRNQ